MNHDIDNLKGWLKQKSIRNRLGAYDIYIVGGVVAILLVIMVSAGFAIFA